MPYDDSQSMKNSFLEKPFLRKMKSSMRVPFEALFWQKNSLLSPKKPFLAKFSVNVYLKIAQVLLKNFQRVKSHRFGKI